MKKTSNREAEARKVYEQFWESYQQGDLVTFASTLDDTFEMIGTSETEICHTKADGIAFLKAQVEELIGKAEMRNRQVNVLPVDQLILVNEQCDVYVLTDSAWHFYSKIRISTLLRETEAGWKVIQQHGSFPDMRVQDGETMAIDKISKENLELRDAVKRRTIELEQKHRELEIEASLERVRAVALGMHKPEDMLDICRMISEQLQLLGVTGIRNIQVAIIDKHIGQYLCYQFFTPYNKEVVEKTEYLKSPVEHEVVKQMLASQDAYFINRLIGPDLDEFREHRKVENHFPDPLLDEAHEISYCFLSIGDGGLGLTVYESMDEGYLEIFKRFHQVFSLAYKRFLDLQKAEAQAREAQIEAALERVRSRTMAMQKSAELQEVIQVVYQQFVLLNIHIDHCGFVMDYKTRDDYHIWIADRVATPSQVTIPYFDCIYYNQFNEAKEKSLDFFATNLTFEEKNSFYRDLFKHVPGLPEEALEFLLTCNGLALSTVLLDDVCLYIENFSGVPYTDDENHTLMRFGKVFQQTYTRFHDLQKAEAQAREARIEAALERVRSRTMAMQRSSELGNVAAELFAQMNQLVTNLWTGGFVLCEKNRDEDEWWLSMDGDFTRGFFLPNIGDYAHATLYEGWQKGDAFRAVQLDGHALQQHYDWLMEIPVSRAIFEEMDAAGLARPDWQKLHAAYFSKGYLVLITREPCGEEEIFKRFAQVFDQTYTRFLDLQKAEAQAREAKIEASLEKVRSRTMGMQSSEELPEVANILFLEVQALGIPAWSCGYNILSDDGRSSTCIMSSEGTLQKPFTLPLTGEVSFLEWHRFIQSEETFFTQELGGRAIEGHYDYMKSLPHLAPVFRDLEEAGLSLPTFQINHLSKFTQGFLLFITYETVPDAHDIFKRFTKVFEQTYTRFLDLKKAEAQAREARIEAALERTRTQSMLMQHSDELHSTAQVFHEQLQLLGIDSEFSYLWLPDEENGNHLFWATWHETANGKIIFQNKAVTYPLDKTEPSIAACYVAWESGEPIHVNPVSPSEIESYFATWSELLGGIEKFKPEHFKNGLYYIDAYMKYGCFGVVITKQLTDDEKKILGRFTIEFERTYTRFLDLQRAETQAREARIEAALEKVRGKAMAMQMPDELKEVAQLLREEMGALGVEELETSSIYIHDEDSGTTQCWFTIKNADDPGRAVTDQMTMDLQETWVGRMMMEFYHSPEKQTSILMQGENRIEWIRYCEEKASLFGTSGFYGETIPERTYHLYKFSNGFVGAASPGDISSESWDLLKRATNVFSFAYTRFHDLQVAEVSAWVALRQASLDRVRADIASMRSTQDLQRITPLIWQELTNLQVSFIRCGVFIMDEDAQIVHTYLSTADGKDIAAIHLPYTGMSITEQAVAHWRKQAVYIEHWDKAAFHQWTKQLIDQGHIASTETYQAGSAPDHLHLHFVPFTQGMLYVGSVNPLPEESIDLIHALAGAFATAYARYEDFSKLEFAKKSTDLALADLEAAKDQLVQQEKLASLGQLTAGIAHEIKNPLNFVNNFSEVSSELLDELLEELENGNAENVKSISDALKANLNKIHEHGSRADSIVKSMLMHSRGGSGQKEPTDINALIREYVNLTFHGMRAGKHPINVRIELNLDPTLGLIPVIEEDISRVIINLCNNAFDAMRSKLSDPSQKSSDYTPKLIVRTKWDANHVLIEIEDNGPGIPDDIKNKILQPFFTTKKGTQGTGLGLSITNDIVKAHGGELKMETIAGEGTSFIIKLPLIE